MAAPPVGDDQARGFDSGLAVEHLRATDPVLARIIDEIGPFRMRLRPASGVFAALAEAIAYQQLNGKGGGRDLRAGVRAVPRRAPTPERMLGIPDEQLRGAGLSRTKLFSLRDLAQRAADGRLPTLAEINGLPDETIVERLSGCGIGRWTAEMLLMFRLGRPDVLPVDDYGVRQGFAIAYKRDLSSPKELAAYGGRWSRIGP
jgi:3-methyladenine DNA glycosylase/8-oxoguanine DNA glycosylase